MSWYTDNMFRWLFEIWSIDLKPVASKFSFFEDLLLQLGALNTLKASVSRSPPEWANCGDLAYYNSATLYWSAF